MNGVLTGELVVGVVVVVVVVVFVGDWIIESPMFGNGPEHCV